MGTEKNHYTNIQQISTYDSTIEDVPNLGSVITLDNKGRLINSQFSKPSLAHGLIKLNSTENIPDADELPYSVISYGDTQNSINLPYNDHNYIGNLCNRKIENYDKKAAEYIMKQSDYNSCKTINTSSLRFNSFSNNYISNSDYSNIKSDDIFSAEKRKSATQLLFNQNINATSTPLANRSNLTTTGHNTIFGSRKQIMGTNNAIVINSNNSGNRVKAMNVIKVNPRTTKDIKNCGDINNTDTRKIMNLPIKTSSAVSNLINNNHITTDNNASIAKSDFSKSYNLIPRCICGYKHDDGSMIRCEICQTWQHIICMYPDNKFPIYYKCEKCEPRDVDYNRALATQTNTLINNGHNPSDFLNCRDISEYDIEASSSFRQINNNNNNNSVVSHANNNIRPMNSTPQFVIVQSASNNISNNNTNTIHNINNINTNITHSLLQNHRHNHQSHPTSLFISNPQSSQLVPPGSPRTSKRKQDLISLSTSGVVTTLSNTTNSTNSTHQYQLTESQSNMNLMSVDLKTALNYVQNPHTNLSIHQLQFLKQYNFKISNSGFEVALVNFNQHILKTTEEFTSTEVIMEYNGSIFLADEVLSEYDYRKFYNPYLLFYDKFNQIPLCISTKDVNTLAKYIRRSCTPNAELKHRYLQNGLIYFYVVPINRISKDSEITIGFGFDFTECEYPIECACNQLSCQVKMVKSLIKNCNSQLTNSVNYSNNSSVIKQSLLNNTNSSSNNNTSNTTNSSNNNIDPLANNFDQSYYNIENYSFLPNDSTQLSKPKRQYRKRGRSNKILGPSNRQLSTTKSVESGYHVSPTTKTVRRNKRGRPPLNRSNGIQRADMSINKKATTSSLMSHNNFVNIIDDENDSNSDSDFDNTNKIEDIEDVACRKRLNQHVDFSEGESEDNEPVFKDDNEANGFGNSSNDTDNDDERHYDEGYLQKQINNSGKRVKKPNPCVNNDRNKILSNENLHPSFRMHSNFKNFKRISTSQWNINAHRKMSNFKKIKLSPARVTPKRKVGRPVKNKEKVNSQLIHKPPEKPMLKTSHQLDSQNNSDSYSNDFKDELDEHFMSISDVYDKHNSSNNSDSKKANDSGKDEGKYWLEEINSKINKQKMKETKKYRHRVKMPERRLFNKRENDYNDNTEMIDESVQQYDSDDNTNSDSKYPRSISSTLASPAQSATTLEPVVNEKIKETKDRKIPVNSNNKRFKKSKKNLKSNSDYILSYKESSIDDLKRDLLLISASMKQNDDDAVQVVGSRHNEIEENEEEMVKEEEIEEEIVILDNQLESMGNLKNKSKKEENDNDNVRMKSAKDEYKSSVDVEDNEIIRQQQLQSQQISNQENINEFYNSSNNSSTNKSKPKSTTKSQLDNSNSSSSSISNKIASREERWVSIMWQRILENEKSTTDSKVIPPPPPHKYQRKRNKSSINDDSMSGGVGNDTIDVLGSNNNNNQYLELDHLDTNNKEVSGNKHKFKRKSNNQQQKGYLSSTDESEMNPNDYNQHYNTSSVENKISKTSLKIDECKQENNITTNGINCNLGHKLSTSNHDEDYDQCELIVYKEQASNPLEKFSRENSLKMFNNATNTSNEASQHMLSPIQSEKHRPHAKKRWLSQALEENLMEDNNVELTESTSGNPIMVSSIDLSENTTENYVDATLAKLEYSSKKSFLPPIITTDTDTQNQLTTNNTIDNNIISNKTPLTSLNNYSYCETSIGQYHNTTLPHKQTAVNPKKRLLNQFSMEDNQLSKYPSSSSNEPEQSKTKLTLSEYRKRRFFDKPAQSMLEISHSTNKYLKHIDSENVVWSESLALKSENVEQQIMEDYKSVEDEDFRTKSIGHNSTTYLEALKHLKTITGSDENDAITDENLNVNYTNENNDNSDILKSYLNTLNNLSIPNRLDPRINRHLEILKDTSLNNDDNDDDDNNGSDVISHQQMTYQDNIDHSLSLDEDNYRVEGEIKSSGPRTPSDKNIELINENYNCLESQTDDVNKYGDDDVDKKEDDQKVDNIDNTDCLSVKSSCSLLEMAINRHTLKEEEYNLTNLVNSHHDTRTEDFQRQYYSESIHSFESQPSPTSDSYFDMEKTGKENVNHEISTVDGSDNVFSSYNNLTSYGINSDWTDHPQLIGRLAGIEQPHLLHEIDEFEDHQYYQNIVTNDNTSHYLHQSQSNSSNDNKTIPQRSQEEIETLLLTQQRDSQIRQWQTVRQLEREKNKLEHKVRSMQRRKQLQQKVSKDNNVDCNNIESNSNSNLMSLATNDEQTMKEFNSQLSSWNFKLVQQIQELKNVSQQSELCPNTDNVLYDLPNSYRILESNDNQDHESIIPTAARSRHKSSDSIKSHQSNTSNQHQFKNETVENLSNNIYNDYYRINSDSSNKTANTSQSPINITTKSSSTFICK